MQQLNELKAIEGECDRVVKGMLDGSMTRDDGLFATAVTLKKTATELVQFVSYALPILHTVHQAMLAAAAQTQAAQAAQAAQTAPVAQAAQTVPVADQAALTPPSLSVVPSGDIQSVDATVRLQP